MLVIGTGITGKLPPNRLTGAYALACVLARADIAGYVHPTPLLPAGQQQNSSHTLKRYVKYAYTPSALISLQR